MKLKGRVRIVVVCHFVLKSELQLAKSCSPPTNSWVEEMYAQLLPVCPSNSAAHQTPVTLSIDDQSFVNRVDALRTSEIRSQLICV